jgi:septal ring factor EnvC (AmiA/AmiB activator)
MRSLFELDIAQLKHVQQAIAEFEARPEAEQARKRYLLDALRQEDKSLRQYCQRAPWLRQQLAASTPENRILELHQGGCLVRRVSNTYEPAGNPKSSQTRHRRLRRAGRAAYGLGMGRKPGDLARLRTSE